MIFRGYPHRRYDKYDCTSAWKLIIPDPLRYQWLNSFYVHFNIMELIVFFSSKYDWPVQKKCYFDYILLVLLSYVRKFNGHLKRSWLSPFFSQIVSRLNSIWSLHSDFVLFLNMIKRGFFLQMERHWKFSSGVFFNHFFGAN